MSAKGNSVMSGIMESLRGEVIQYPLHGHAQRLLHDRASRVILCEK